MVFICKDWNELNHEFMHTDQLGYIKIIEKEWVEDSRIAYTLAELTLVLEVDMYHIVKMNKGKAIANIAKIFKKKRKNQVCSEIKKEIENGFYDEINKEAGLLAFASNLAVTVKKIMVG